MRGGSEFMDSFWTGFQQGGALADEYDEKKRRGIVRRGMQEIDKQQTTAPTPQQQSAYDQENAATAQQDAQTFGIQTDAKDYQYGDAPKLAESRKLSGSERYRQMEGLYRQQGFDEQADRYGVRADTAEQQDKQEVRQAKKDKQADELHGYQVRGLKRSEDDANAKDTYEKAYGSYMADVQAGKRPFNVGEIYKIGADAGVPMDMVNQNLLTKLGVDEKVATAKAHERIVALQEAAAKGEDALLAMADPDPTDDPRIKPEIVRKKDGSSVVMYGGKPLMELPPESREMSRSDMIFMKLKGIAEGNPIAAGIQFLAQEKARAEIGETRAKTGLYGAQTRDNDASARLKDRTDPNIRSGFGLGFGSGSKYAGWAPKDLNARAESLRKGKADLTKALQQMESMAPPNAADDPTYQAQHSALVNQYNAAVADENELAQYIKGGAQAAVPTQQTGGTPAPQAPQVDPASADKYMERARQAVSSGAMSLEQVNAELRARGLPEIDAPSNGAPKRRADSYRRPPVGVGPGAHGPDMR